MQYFKFLINGLFLIWIIRNKPFLFILGGLEVACRYKKFDGNRVRKGRT